MNLLILILSTTPSSLIDSSLISEIGDLISSILSWIVDNRMLLVFFTLSMIGTVIGIVRRLRRTVR